MLSPKYRVAGISFEHMHMGDNLHMVAAHPDCEVVGICDSTPDRMADVTESLGIGENRVFTDWQRCLEVARPDWVVLCPATADHGLWVERLAPFGLPLLLEKPMASTLEEADRMIDTCLRHNVTWAINWPLVWVPSHRTAKRLVSEGRIGRVIEVHFYDGNRGPLWHTAGKREISADEVLREKPHSWFYKRASGGGSLLDYLGYGVTLGTWFMDGAKPIEVTCMVDQPSGLEVDEHSVTVARYEHGLSKFETRWGTFTDPWVHQPQPKCGFVLVGTAGTISSFDYEPTIRVQDRHHAEGLDIPVDTIYAPDKNPVEYFVDCLRSGKKIEGPLSPRISRIGQQIIDSAVLSAKEKRTVSLLG